MKSFKVRYFDNMKNTIGRRFVIIKARTLSAAAEIAEYRAINRVEYSVYSIKEIL